MRLIVTTLLALVLATPARAQATTAIEVAAFPASATNPAIAMPLAPAVSYPMAGVVCNQPKAGEVMPIVNPEEFRIDDPANRTTRDCQVNIAPQFSALPIGTGYRAAWRTRTTTGVLPWSPLGTPFTITAPPQVHPCDGAAPTAGTTLEGSRTLSWCWDGLDTNGVATTVLNWVITIDGTRLVPTGVSVGAPNAAGRRLYSALIPLTRGTRVVRVAGVNAVGEAAFSQAFTVTVGVPPAVMSVADVRGIS